MPITSIPGDQSYNYSISQESAPKTVKNTVTKSIAPPVAQEIEMVNLQSPIKSLSAGQDVEQELQTLLSKYEIEIGNTIFKLEKESQSLMPKSHEGPPSSKRHKQIKFLKTVLPEHILQNPAIKGRFDEGFVQIGLGDALIRASDSGLKCLALIYKSKILSQANQILQKVKSLYKNNKDLIPPEIREWEINLREEEKNLKIDFIKFGFKTAERGSSTAYNLLQFVPLTGIIKPQSAAAISNVSGAVSILGFVLAAINLKESVSASKTFNAWVEKFRVWQGATELHGAIQQLPKGEKPYRPLSVSKILRNISGPSKTFQAQFKKMIAEAAGIEQIRSVLYEIDVHLDPSINTKQQFLTLMEHHPSLKRKIMSQYIGYREAIAKLDKIIATSKNLIEKREAIAEKKVLLLKPKFEEKKTELLKMNRSRFDKAFDQLLTNTSNPNIELKRIRSQLRELGLEINADNKDDIKARLISMKNNPQDLNNNYSKWFSIQSKETLLRPYVDHQETLEITTKNALKGIVNRKHEIEGLFVKFKLVAAKLLFAFVTLSLISGAIALALTPAGPVVYFTMAITIGLYASGFGSMAIGYRMSKKYRSSGAGLFESLSLKFQSLYASIKEYQLLSKQRKLVEMAKNISQLVPQSRSKEYQQSIKNYKKAEEELLENFQQVEEWQRKVKTLENKLADRAWDDFVKHAQLSSKKDPTEFDTIRALKEALEKCDFSLFSPETTHFFEEQLGIDLTKMKKEMQKDPDALTRGLKHFINLDETRMNYFIKHQQAHQRSSTSTSKNLKL